MIDLDKLETLANAASPGNWIVGHENDWKGTASVLIALDGENVDEFVTGQIDHRDARFIAAVDPQTVLQLITEVRRCREGGS